MLLVVVVVVFLFQSSKYSSFEISSAAIVNIPNTSASLWLGKIILTCNCIFFFGSTLFWFSNNSWQVGGPLAHTNKFLKKHETQEKIAIGGIMNAKNKAPLRIDTTQHQMHALMMALDTLFPEDEGAAVSKE